MMGAFTALSLHWAAGFSPAVTKWYSVGRLGSLGKECFVVPKYYRAMLCHVGHATIAHFDVIFIAYLVQARREVFFEQVKEDLADVSLYMLAEGWVKPHYVLLSGFPFMRAGWADLLQLTGMSTSLHSLFILWDSSGEFLAVV